MTRRISGFVTLFTLATAICAATYIMLLRTGEPFVYYPGVLMIYAPLLYGFNILFLKKERTVEQFATINAIAGILLFASVIIVNGFYSVVYTMFAAAFITWLTYSAQKYAQEPPRLQNVIYMLDLAAVMLAMIILCKYQMGFSTVWCIPVACGFVVALAGSLCTRVGRRLGVRELGVACGVFALIAVIVTLAAKYLMEPVGKAVSAGARAALSGLAFVFHAVNAFLSWFFGLFTVDLDGELAEPPLLPEAPGADMTMENQSISQFLLYLFFAIIVGLIIIAIVIFFKSRKNAVRGARIRIKGEKGEKISSKGFGELVRKLALAVRVRIYLVSNRNKPLGLFYSVERKLRHGSMRRESGETPREFILKLANAGEDDEFKSAAARLVPAVERALFADPETFKETVFDGAAAVRRGVRHL